MKDEIGQVHDVEIRGLGLKNEMMMTGAETMGEKRRGNKDREEKRSGVEGRGERREERGDRYRRCGR